MKLKPNGEDAVYALAPAGSEGWVRGLKLDSVGWPMILIEWDRDHWTYNKEPDGWTFEEHFEPVEDEMSEEGNIEEQFEAFKKWQAEQQGGVEPVEIDVAERYQQDLRDATEIAKKAEGFFMVLIERQDDGVDLGFVPRVFNSLKDERIGALLESQLGIIAGYAHQQLAIELIRQQAQGEQ